MFTTVMIMILQAAARMLMIATGMGMADTMATVAAAAAPGVQGPAAVGVAAVEAISQYKGKKQLNTIMLCVSFTFAAIINCHEF